MNRKIFTAIITVICCAFVITLGATSIVLYSDYKAGSQAAEKRFEKLFNQTENAISKTGVPDRQFLEMFKSEIGSTEYYYSINLKSGNDDIYFLSDKSESASSLFTVTKSRRITEGSTIDLTLTVVMYAIPNTLVYSRLQIAFIFTFIITILSAICLIYLYKFSTSIKTVEDKKNENNEESDLINDDIILDDDEDFIFDEDKNFDLNIPEEDNIDDIQNDSYNLVTSDSDTVLTDDIKENNLSEPTIEENTDTHSENEIMISESAKKTEETKESDTVNDTALFSPVTGFCDEKYLVSRLESELSRASSSELDVSLILIKIPDVNFEDNCGKTICNQILSIFHYKDIIFNYKNDGIAIIYNGADIDKAMEVSEQIYAEICSAINTNNLESKPSIGIAARTLRFISGDRLILEAEQALIHAQEDSESPIIAFRVNPEKYRKFMANKD